ncbi:DUF2500 domain-containing protein [Terrabacter sp. 2RAF25]|uniref:DUF2500 domain-containing protein n=1 Tax=Terrabacter sp. 2RAF25 TaxID=3232998 RepID=UPI003F9DBB75
MFDANGMETVVLIFIGAVALLTAVGVGVVAVKGISQWRANEAAPLRSVETLVVSRRTDVRRRAGSEATGSSTRYFATFEDESGARVELALTGAQYGRLAEGDRGHLIHQGTRYKGFTRAGG